MELTIITGGSKGIGQCLVHHLLQHGPVLNISRSPAVFGSMAKYQHKLFNLCQDLSDLSGVEKSLNTWLHDHPEFFVSLFISNAAALGLGWLAELTAENMQEGFATNALAPLTISSLLYRHKKFAARGSRIIYVTSSLGRNSEQLSFAGIGLYSATKAALGRMACVQRREFALQSPGITVTQVHPGIVDTAMQNDLRRSDGIDPAFAAKTAGLPPYQQGDWDTAAPAEKMRTIPADLAADFIFWVSRVPGAALGYEYDIYSCTPFHEAMRRESSQEQTR